MEPAGYPTGSWQSERFQISYPGKNLGRLYWFVALPATTIQLIPFVEESKGTLVQQAANLGAWSSSTFCPLNTPCPASCSRVEAIWDLVIFPNS